MRFLLAGLLISAVLDNDEDAEKHIVAMEKKLAGAKSLRVSFEAKVEGLPSFGNLKATLALAEGNKLHLDGAFVNEDETNKWKLVSNGMRIKAQGSIVKGVRAGEGFGKAPSDKLTDNYRSCLAHGGYLMVGFYISSVKPKEIWPVFRASDFKSKGKEKIGKREAHVVVCKLTPMQKVEKDRVRWSETVWLDAQTNLPLKRVVTYTFDGKKATFTETYKEFAVDPKLDPDIFVLPK